MSITLRSEALPLHKLYACVSSKSLLDSERPSDYRVFQMNPQIVRLLGHTDPKQGIGLFKCLTRSEGILMESGALEKQHKRN